MTYLFNDPAEFASDAVTGLALAHPDHVAVVHGGVVRAFLKVGGFTVRPERPIWPDTDGTDGFYLCLMERSQ